MNLTTYSRRKAHEVNIGGVKVGSSHPIQVQSMTNTPTADTVSSVEQVKRIADAGAPIVRLTAQGRKEGENLENIVARDLEMVLEDTVRYLSFRYDGREVKKVKGLGKFNTIKFRCKIATSDGFSFTDGTEFMVWISDDRNKIPLYIESPIKVGSVCAYLSSYEGLRYPLDCFIKK